MTVIVAGHTGLVGSAIYELLTSRNEKVLGINSKVVDLLDRKATFGFMVLDKLKCRLTIEQINNF